MISSALNTKSYIVSFTMCIQNDMYTACEYLKEPTFDHALVMFAATLLTLEKHVV